LAIGILGAWRLVGGFHFDRTRDEQRRLLPTREKMTRHRLIAREIIDAMERRKIRHWLDVGECCTKEKMVIGILRKHFGMAIPVDTKSHPVKASPK
jgi:hypothetical protein